MRVETHTLEDFIQNLGNVSNIFEDCIRVNVTRQPIDSDNRHEAVKFNVNFQCSAVCRTEEGLEYLLQFGEDCGTDYEDSTPEYKGSEKANAMKGQINAFAEKKDWKVLPGIIHE